jgi:hypothetical protein
MTLDEAIKHYEEVAEQYEAQADKWEEEGSERWGKTLSCRECAREHRQLGEWLIELKQLREQQTCKEDINRQVVKEQMIKYGFHAPDMTVTEFAEDLLPVALKSVTVTDSADKFKEIDFKTIKNGKFVNDKE